MSKLKILILTIAVLAIGAFVVLRKPDFFEEAQKKFQKNNKIEQKFFGFDFWGGDAKIWREILNLMNEDNLNFGLVGYGWGWEKVEPNPPQQGRHIYDWSTLDGLVKAAADSDRQLDFDILSRSNWATIVPYSSMDEECCDMSPPKEDTDSDISAWGMTAYQAWSDFVFNLIERYDGDGLNDAPGITKLAIKYLHLGAEIETPAHFSNYGGSPQLYDRILQVTYEAAKRANPNIIVVRGRSNPANIFDDDPDETTFRARWPGYFDFLSTSLSLGGEYFDIFAINFNDHYTGLSPFVRWLKTEMAKNDYSKPFLVGDARTTLYPRDNNAKNNILPPRYPSDFIDSLKNPAHPKYIANRRISFADESRQSMRKILITLTNDQEAISLQPAASGPIHENPLWQESGLFDARVYLSTKDLRKARKPVYYAAKQIINILLGADKKVKTLELGKNIYAYEISKEGEKIIFFWHENPFDTDAQGLTKRNQKVTVNLKPFVSTVQVRLKNFVTEIDENYSPIYPADVIMPSDKVSIDETPVFVEE